MKLCFKHKQTHKNQSSVPVNQQQAWRKLFSLLLWSLRIQCCPTMGCKGGAKGTLVHPELTTGLTMLFTGYKLLKGEELPTL